MPKYECSFRPANFRPFVRRVILLYLCPAPRTQRHDAYQTLCSCYLSYFRVVRAMMETTAPLSTLRLHVITRA